MYGVWAYTKMLEYIVHMQSVYIYCSIIASMYKFRPVKLLSWKWLLLLIPVCFCAYAHHL